MEESKNNYLGCIFKFKNDFGLAFVDLMTGEFNITEIKSEYPYHEIINEVSRFESKECLANIEVAKEKLLSKKLKQSLKLYLTFKNDENYFNEQIALDLLVSQFGKEKVKGIRRKS